MDVTKINDKWETIEQRLIAEGSTKEEIEIEKKNFRILDAQRQYVEDSFDYVIESVGIYENREIVKLACRILNDKLTTMVSSIESRIIPIHPSETTMDHCYDVILENEDYTMGKIIEYFIYTKYYLEEKTVSFIGFKKFHPHSPDSTLRIAFFKPVDEDFISNYLREACVNLTELYKKIHGMF
jgi:DNA-directed RNA polymerase subunit L